MADATGASVIAGIVSAVSTSGIGAYLLKGTSIVLRRELDEAKKISAERLAEKDRQIAELKVDYEARLQVVRDDNEKAAAKMEQANHLLQTDLKEAHRVTVEQSKQVMDALSYIRGLAGLAQQDRRANRG